MKTTLIIYLTADRKSYRVVKPDMQYFNQDWAGLAHAVTGGNYHYFELQ